MSACIYPAWVESQYHESRMRKQYINRPFVRTAGPQGLLIVLSVCLPALTWLGTFTDPPPAWRIGAGFLAAIFCLLCALSMIDSVLLGKIFGLLALLAAGVAAWPYLIHDPFAALAGIVMFIYIAFSLYDYREPQTKQRKSTHPDRCKQRLLWGGMVLPVIAFFVENTDQLPGLLANGILVAATILELVLFGQWVRLQTPPIKIWLHLAGLAVPGALGLAFYYQVILSFSIIIALLLIVLAWPLQSVFENRFYWWETFLNHPARLLFSTFLFLCFVGSILLSLPVARNSQSIATVDAVFTSVSAVCVTGLAVLDTPTQFSLIGQFIILLLIQLGGLGIMTITTVAMQVMGIRMSLRQERALTSMTNTDHRNLLHSLVTILKLTFLIELIGTVLLTVLFWQAGDHPAMAFWRGLFTAISAFCNAGFALQSNSLVNYNTNTAILTVVSWLIVIGGLAPATTLLLPRYLRRQPIPISDRIAILTSIALLIFGTGAILVLEWNGELRRFGFQDKLLNAWFQSVTLRTAGFNTIAIQHVVSPVYLIMLMLMFIGGSPGGTAGGIKTTTIGILMTAFWTKITNRHEIIIQHTRVRPGSIYRAVTILISGIIIWFATVLILEITQQLPARDIIFEATSALATVGLSTGITASLDPIGKVIVIIVMFIGRTGPMTLFTLLSEDQANPIPDSPDVRISLN
ncbi:MAG: hypothetical protein KDK39_13335 [Leptospiraceae bacterium]|nr:hypothetical protein [Leptospiraceae bacterium]